MLLEDADVALDAEPSSKESKVETATFYSREAEGNRCFGKDASTTKEQSKTKVQHTEYVHTCLQFPHLVRIRVQ
jgi:hypothetical protein